MAGFPQLGYGQVRGGAIAPAQIPTDLAAAAGGGLFTGIGKALDLAAGLAKKEQDARDAVSVSDAITRVSGELDEYRRGLDSEADYKAREPKFERRAQEAYDRELKALPSTAQQDFHLRYNRVKGALAVQVRHDRRDAEIQDARLKLEANNDELLNKALFARSPQESAAFLDQVRRNIEGAVRTGALTAVMAHTLMRRSSIKLQAGQAQELIRTNPGAAITALRNPENFPHLDATTRQTLLLQAQQRGESLGAQARAEIRADLSDYRAARAAGQPVSPEETGRLRARAQAAGLGRGFDGMKDFYDRVENHTVGKTLPQLRDAVRELEGTGTVADAGVARAVRAQLTAEERAASRQLDEQFRDFEKYRSRGEAYPKLDELLKRAEDYGGPTAADTIRSRDAFWTRVQAAQGEPASGTAGRLAQIDRERRAAQGGTLTVQDLEERAALRKALEHKLELAEKDPAAYARRFYPTIDEAIRAAEAAGDAGEARRQHAALIEAQRREGIPEHRIALLTKTEADAIAARLTSTHAEQRLAEIDRLRALYSPEDWKHVRRQMGDKKLPPDVEVLATLPQADERVRVKLAEAFTLTKSEAEKNIGADSVKTLTGIVDGRGADVQAIYRGVPGGADYFASLKGAAERLALLYATQGMGSRQAAATAWDDVFYRHWDISAGVRIPKVGGVPVADPADVKLRQRDMIRALDRLPVDPARWQGRDALPLEQQRDITRAEIARHGFWITNPDDRGAILYSAPGVPVMVGGRPYYMPFAPGVDRSIFEEIAPSPMSDAQLRNIERERARARAMSAPAGRQP